MNTDNIITLPGLQSELAGAIIYWRLSGETKHDKLEAAWAATGLDINWLPSLPSDKVALHRAVNDQKKPHRFIRKHPDGGWCIVDEHADKEKGLDFEVSCRVKMGDHHPEVIPNTHTAMPAVSAAYWHHKAVLSSKDIGSWLTTKMMEKLDAVSLRDHGGVYFIPNKNVPLLGQISEALHACSHTKIFQIAAVKDDDAVEAVLDAIIRGAEAEADSIEADLGFDEEYLDMLPEEIEAAKASKGEDDKKTLGPRALRSRAEQCERMTKKVERYEELLDTKLDSLRERLGRLSAASVEAAMELERQKEAEKVQQEVQREASVKALMA